MTGFLNDNQGWWGFLAVPLALAAVLTGLSQLYQTSKTTRLSDDDRWQALLATMVRNRSLSLRQGRGDFQLPVRLFGQTDQALPDPANALTTHLVGGGCAEVIGGAGSGKSYLAVEVRAASLRQPAGTVVVDVVSARDWRARDEDVAVWASAVLQQRYRIFRRSYLRRLIDGSRIILAVDGFDEVDPELADRLWQAILDHAARLPLMVLRRTGGSISTVTAERLSFYEFTRYKVKPLGELAVAAFLRERFTWYDQLAQARRPDRVRWMLTNPLRLHLAARTWSRTEPPLEILTAEDPVRVLWTDFLRKKLDRSALGHQDPRLRRAVQVLALSADSSATTLRQAFHDSRAGWLTIVALTALVVPLAWSHDDLALGVITLWGIASALRPGGPSVLLGVPLRRLRPLPYPAHLAMTMLVLTAGYVLVALASGGLPEPREFLSTGLLIAVLVTVNEQGASSTDSDLLSNFPDWDRMPFRDHLWPRVVVGGIFLSFPELYGPLWPIGVIFLATALHGAMCAGLFAWYLKSPFRTVEILRGLEELGIVYQANSQFRLVHQEIADNVARDVLERVDDLPRHVRMITSSRSARIVSTMTLHRDAPSTRKLVLQLLKRYPDSQNLAALTAMLLIHGSPDLPKAIRVLRGFPGRAVSGFLAEAHLTMGEVDEARVVMADTVRRLPDHPVVLAQASRLAFALDGPDAGIQVLRDALDRLEGGDRNFFEAWLTIKESQWDRVPDDSSLARLDALAATRGPGRDLVVLEAARRRSECRGEHERAAAMLTRLEQAGGTHEIVPARLAQVHLHLGNHEKAARYASRLTRELSWASEPELQLEVAITAAATTDDVFARELVTRLATGGWPMPERLATLDRDLRALRLPQSGRPAAARGARAGRDHGPEGAAGRIL